MKSRSLWLTVYIVIIFALLFLLVSLNNIVQTPKINDTYTVEGLDPTNMANYYAMGEYYPPDEIDTLNITWQGGRVEIIAYNDEQYFIEEAATRQLSEDERLSYSMKGNTFSIFYTADEDVKIEDAYKKLEIRVPKSLAQHLKAVNVATNGEVVMRNFHTDKLIINNTLGEIRLGNVTADNANIQTTKGNIDIAITDNVGYDFSFDTKNYEIKTELEYSETNGNIIFNDGAYKFKIKTSDGKFIVEDFIINDN